MYALNKLIEVERTENLSRKFIALRRVLRRIAPLIPLFPVVTAGLIGCADKEYTYTCYKTDEPIKIDGRLDETSWGRAKPIDKFVIYDGSRVARYQTCVKILWDEKRLYIAFICQDSDICATMRQRDQSLYKEDDVVELFIDADGDGKTYFEIEVNPLGTLLDVRFIDVNVPDNGRNWNGDINRAVWVNGTIQNRNDRDTFWSVEIAIPFANVVTAPHIPPEDGDLWRVNFYRIERARSCTEYSAWAPVGKLDFHQPSKFGKLIFSEKRS